MHDVKAIIIGQDRGRFKAEINFDAEVLARRCMEKCRSELKVRRVRRAVRVSGFGFRVQGSLRV